MRTRAVWLFLVAGERRESHFLVESGLVLDRAVPLADLDTRPRTEVDRLADPGTRVGLGIVDRDGDREGVLVHALIALGQPQLLTVGIAVVVEPQLVVEAAR